MTLTPARPWPRPLLQGSPLAEDARLLAQQLLGTSGDRWLHTRETAAVAAGLARVVAPPELRPALVAAAWLHEIGSVRSLRRSTFHPLNGAWFLQENGWPLFVAGLVAHHSASRYLSAVRGLDGQLGRFHDRRYSAGPLADALTYADQTTGPDGLPTTVALRLADTVRRHGPHSAHARCHPERSAAIHAAAGRTRRLAGVHLG